MPRTRKEAPVCHLKKMKSEPDQDHPRQDTDQDPDLLNDIADQSQHPNLERGLISEERKVDLLLGNVRNDPGPVRSEEAPGRALDEADQDQGRTEDLHQSLDPGVRLNVQNRDPDQNRSLF